MSVRSVKGIRSARRAAYAAAADFLRDTALWDLFDAQITEQNEEALHRAAMDVAAALDKKAGRK